MSTTRLGELIAIARECKGWTLRKLEAECGVSNALLSQIELGRVKHPGFSTVVRICLALGIKLTRAADCVRPLTAEDLKSILRRDGKPVPPRSHAS